MMLDLLGIEKPPDGKYVVPAPLPQGTPRRVHPTDVNVIYHNPEWLETHLHETNAAYLKAVVTQVLDNEKVSMLCN